MDSIWEFIEKPTHFGAEGSAGKDFLYGLDKNAKEIKKRLVSHLWEVYEGTLPDINSKNLEDDLQEHEANTGGTILHAFLKNSGSGVPLGRANRFDQFIWDLYLRTGTKHFQVLTMFTNDIQANYFLLWKQSRGTFRLYQFFCSFFAVRRTDGKTVMRLDDLSFMEKTGALKDTEVTKIRKKGKELSDLLYWNQFVVDPSILPTGRTDNILFRRRFLMLQHSCRTHFQNVALLTEALDPSDISKLHPAFKGTAKFPTCLDAAKAFYDALGRQKSWVAAWARQ